MTKLQWTDKERGGPHPPQLDASSVFPSSDEITVQYDDQTVRSYKYLGERALTLGFGLANVRHMYFSLQLRGCRALS